MTKVKVRTAVALAAVGLTLAACSGGKAPPAGRPSSTAVVAIVAPTNGQIVQGPSVGLRVSLTGAKIVPASSTNLKPDEGHLHVYLDDKIVSMTFGLDQEIPNVPPGQHTLRVEFVASDHEPFDPRVFVSVLFEVQG
jgi:hypothetical protein